jgi:protein ImuA
VFVIQNKKRTHYMTTPSVYTPLQLLTSPASVWQRESSSRHSSQGERAAGSLFTTGIVQSGLLEIYALTQADGAAVTGFALANASQLLSRKRSAGSRCAILWARHDLMHSEAGAIYPPGLNEFGITPKAIAMVQTHNVLDTLQAGLDAARCGALAAVIVEFWGTTRNYDLTASRKL